MQTIFFKGSPCHTYGEIPAVGTEAPGFDLTGKDLSDIRLSDFDGKRVVLNVFPSLDTPVCAMSVRRFVRSELRAEDGRRPSRRTPRPCRYRNR